MRFCIELYVTFVGHFLWHSFAHVGIFCIISGFRGDAHFDNLWAIFSDIFSDIPVGISCGHFIRHFSQHNIF